MNKTYDINYAKLPHEIQSKTDLRHTPIGLPEDTVRESLAVLEQILVDTSMLYSLYKKHHWQLLGPTFYQLHLLFDKHAEEQNVLVDTLAERMQLLGGVAIAMPGDIAERTSIDTPPAGAETIPAMLTRLVDAHKIIIKNVRDAAEKTEENKDLGTNDLLVSQVLRTNELQSWFIAAHLSDVDLVEESKVTK